MPSLCSCQLPSSHMLLNRDGFVEKYPFLSSLNAAFSYAHAFKSKRSFVDCSRGQNYFFYSVMRTTLPVVFTIMLPVHYNPTL